jgi:hypothetical protein
MADVRQPMVGVHHHVPLPGTYGLAAPAGFPTHARSLHALRIHAWVAAATVPAARTYSFSRLDNLEWCGLRPAVANELLQHHGAPTTSCLHPRLGSRFRCLASHHSFGW